MAVDMFLKLGDIAGDSVDKVHKGEIDVLAWSWGVSNSGNTHQGGGGGAGKANFADLNLTTYVDRASPAIMGAISKGLHYTDAKLTIRKSSGTAVEFIKLTLMEVLVTGQSLSGASGEDRPTQQISLNFGKFKYEYTPQNAKGQAETTLPFEFDIAGNGGD